jgi:hypothetical protein
MKSLYRSRNPADVKVAYPTELDTRIQKIQSKHCRSILQEANKSLQLGNFLESTKHSAAAIEFLFSQRVEPVLGRTRKVLPWPKANLEVILTEHGQKVQLLNPIYIYTQSEAEEVLQYSLRLYELLFSTHNTEFMHMIPRRTVLEVIYIYLKGLSRECMLSNLPLGVKRGRLKNLGKFQFRLLQWLPLGRDFITAQTFAVGRLLNEPEREMRQMLRSNNIYSEYNYAKRLIHLNNKSESKNIIQRFHWPQRDEYLNYIADNQCSRVLVTIHMGDIYGAFNCIASVSDRNRSVISLRLEGRDDDGHERFAAECVNHLTFRHGQQNPLTVVSALRKGNHTLAVLFDLTKHFGETVEVMFFGQKARFVKGPAELAIMGRTAIFPFVTYEQDGLDCIDMEAVIDTRLFPEETLEQGVVRITQRLVTLAEKWIRRNPDQWKYLSSVMDYLQSRAIRTETNV